MKMVDKKSSYESVANKLNKPWNFIAIIHCIEGSLSFEKHLHNGDTLRARTVQVPKGRPIAGKLPFSWEESAIDALTLHGFTKSIDWSIPSMLFSLKHTMVWDIEKRVLIHPIYGVSPTII